MQITEQSLHTGGISVFADRGTLGMCAVTVIAPAVKYGVLLLGQMREELCHCFCLCGGTHEIQRTRVERFGGGEAVLYQLLAYQYLKDSVPKK